ncbi:hypothetical protein MASR1M45_29810 [Candidatus Kapaibacterium sp.]
MRKINYILITATLLIAAMSNVNAANRDTMALIKIVDCRFVDDFDVLEFDLYLERKSEKWDRFVNGTFSIYFPDSLTNRLTPDRLEFADVIVSQLKRDISPGGGNLPTKGYRTDFQLYDNRLSITILGPEKYEDCEFIDTAKAYLLGTIRLKAANGEKWPDYKVKWLTPHYWYQAAAFKTENDVLHNNNIVLNESDDNLAMEDSTSITYVFVDDTTRRKFEFIRFDADYVGQRKVDFSWQVRREYDIIGYEVWRGAYNPSVDREVVFTDLLGTWRPGPKYNPLYKVERFYSQTRTIGPLDDIIEFRGGEYVYALRATIRQEGVEFDTLLATDKIYAPRSVVAQAKPIRNPFSDFTEIEFTLEDDVNLFARVTDLLGKEVMILSLGNMKIDNVFMKKGQYRAVIRSDELGMQGYYNVIFTAYPIEDPTVELSTAVVKLQLVK